MNDTLALLMDAMRDADLDTNTCLGQAVARLKHPFVLGDGKKWHYDGFIQTASAVRQALAAIDGAISPDLPVFLLDPATYAQYFGIPLENFNWQGGREGDILRIESKIDQLLSATEPTKTTIPTKPFRGKRVPRWYKPGQWYHLPEESPPEEYKAGPLEGTRRELSDLLRPGADDRELERRANTQSVWVRRNSGDHWGVWFRDKEFYAFANRNRLLKRQQNTTD